MNSIITINGAPIRQYPGDLYCLNDLHEASGKKNKQRPGNWLINKKTKEVIELLSTGELPVIRVVHGGANPGTFVSKELVFAYALWVSPEFFVKALKELPLIKSLHGSEVSS